MTIDSTVSPTFTQLHLDPKIADALTACGYTNPTPIQSRAIPEILAGKDLVASAQTGTGKTAAFVLPILHRLSQKKADNNKPRVLILTPTRELATQITTAIAKYGKFLRVNTASLLGGMPYRQQLKSLSRPVDIVIATPGRLMDHLENKRLDLSSLEVLVLDEADRMLDVGFSADVKLISQCTPATRQTLLFSATVDSKLGTVIKTLLNNPVRIDLSQEKMSADHIHQKIYLADDLKHKTKLLQHFVKNENCYKAIIFSATKMNADQLTYQLQQDGHSAAVLHGDLKQAVRNRTLDAMRQGKIQFLIATDVAARGIDITDITHVINFDLPKFHEDYVHRIGRTGRAGKSGIAISFALPDDGRHLQGIERFIGQKLELNSIEGLEAKKTFNFNSSGKKKFGRGGNGGSSHNNNNRSGSGRSSSSSSGKPRFKTEFKPKYKSEGGFRDNNRDNRDSRDSRDNRDNRDSRESNSRDRDNRNSRDFRDTRDNRSSYTRDTRSQKENMRENVRDNFRNNDSRSNRDSNRDNRGSKERDTRPSSNRDTRNNFRDSRPSSTGDRRPSSDRKPAGNKSQSSRPFKREFTEKRFEERRR